MPLYIFKCRECSAEQRRICTSDIEYTRCKECGNLCVKQLPTSITSVTKMMKDPRRGVQVNKNQEKQLQKRMRDHNDRQELEEKIDKFGSDDMIKNGWDKKIKRL